MKTIEIPIEEYKELIWKTAHAEVREQLVVLGDEISKLTEEVESYKDKYYTEIGKRLNAENKVEEYEKLLNVEIELPEEEENAENL